MRKLISLLATTVLVVSLSACATTTTPRDETAQIKCPACGYSFETPKAGEPH